VATFMTTVAGIEQTIELCPIPRSLLDFVEVAIVGIRRAVRLFVVVDVMGFRFFGHGGTGVPLRCGGYPGGRPLSLCIGDLIVARH
jgi:hypothetical protein